MTGFSKIKANNVASISRVEKWPPDVRDYVDERTLSEEALRAAAVKFLGKDKAEERTGYAARGLIWPFLDFKTGNPTDYCLLKPIPVTNKRFLVPKGESRVYFASTFALDKTWPEIAVDTNITIYIPEGPGKATRLAQEKRASLCGNGVNGLGGLKKGFKKELKLIQWKSRRVIFVPDSDWETNFRVRLATITNADHLRALGADCRIILLPTLPGHDKTGSDDFLSDEKYGGIERMDGLTAYPSTDNEIFNAWRVRPEIVELNRKHAVVTMSSDVRIVVEPDAIEPVPRFISASAFRLQYADCHVVVGQNRNGDIVKTAAEVWLSSEHRRKYNSVGFDPSGNAPPGLYNYWRGWAYEPKAGDWSLFKAHILEVIVGGNQEHFDWVINWMAHRVQYPGERNEVVIVLQSAEEGIGKTYFAEKFGALFGIHFIVVDKSEDIVGRFVARLRYGMLIFADEAFFAGDPKAADILKSMVTAKSLRIEPKGQEVFTVPNILGLIMASNHEHVVRAGLNARRYAVFDVDPAHLEDHAYFAAITKQMEDGGYQAMLYDLMNVIVDMSAARRAPRTKALGMQKLYSLPHAERFILQCLCDDGRIPNWVPPKSRRDGRGSQTHNWSATEDIQIVRSELQIEFHHFLEQQHAKEHDYKAMQTILGSALRRIFGNIKSVQYTDSDGSHKRRDVLPTLPQARTHFEAVTQNRWNWRTGEPKGK